VEKNTTMMKYYSWNIFFFVIIAIQIPGSQSVLQDHSFSQYRATKYTTTLSNISDFKVLNIDSSEDILQVKLNQYGGTFIVTNKSLYLCNNYNLNTGCNKIYKIEAANPKFAIIIDLDKHNTAEDSIYYGALIYSNRIDILKCTSSAPHTDCNHIKSNTEQRYGSVIHSVDSSANMILIASNEGVFSISVQSILANEKNIVNWYKPDPCSLSLSGNTTNVYEVKCANAITCLASTEICMSWMNLTTGATYKHEWTGGLVDGVAKSISFTSTNVGQKSIWVGTALSLNEYNIISDSNIDDNKEEDYVKGLWKRFAGRPGEDGLPVRATCMDMATASSTADGITVLLATSKGIVVYSPNNSNHGEEFEFLSSPRWLTTINANERVISIDISNDGNIIVAATKYGISVIDKVVWTLEDKANYFQNDVVPRHFRPVTNLISALSLEKFGDLSSALNHQPSDNDGLWSAQYLASQSFRYKVTGDEHAYEEAMKALSSLEGLMNVTGEKGFPARTMTENGKYKTNSHWGWNESPTREGWWFIANTSSDEITGHMFGYSIFLDHAAKNDEDKKRALYLLESIITRIIHDGFVLKDITGLTTHWGVWAPEDLNGEFGWSDERGLNSLQILSYLLTASKHTESEKSKMLYNNALLELLNEKNHYHINILNQKITAPSEINFSDNELSFKPYYIISNACNFGIFRTNVNHRKDTNAQDQALDAICEMLRPYYKNSLQRAFNIIQKEKVPEFNYIYNASIPEYINKVQKKSTLPSTWITDAFYTLAKYPIDLIVWPVNNAGRLDLPIDVSHQPYINRSLVLIPRHQSAALRWSFNPFLYVAGAGVQEEDPTFWLLSYWMGRFHESIFLK
jgi:hypothetical protein